MSYRRKEDRNRRDAYIIAQHETQTWQQIADHFGCEVSSIRRSAKRLGLPLGGVPQRIRRIKAMLPPNGRLSGPAPSYIEMCEYRDAEPAIDPFTAMMCAVEVKR